MVMVMVMVCAEPATGGAAPVGDGDDARTVPETHVHAAGEAVRACPG